MSSGPSRIYRGEDWGKAPTTRRSCIRCHRDFDSYGVGNRMCEPCRVKSADASPYAL